MFFEKQPIGGKVYVNTWQFLKVINESRRDQNRRWTEKFLRKSGTYFLAIKKDICNANQFFLKKNTSISFEKKTKKSKF